MNNIYKLVGIAHFSGDKSGKKYDFYVLHFENLHSDRVQGVETIQATAGRLIAINELVLGSDYCADISYSNGRAYCAYLKEC